MIDYGLNLNTNTLTFSSSFHLKESIIPYKITYASGLDGYVKTYTVKYSTEQLTGHGNEYRLRNTYEYDDKITRYIIRYSSGRSIEDVNTVYRIRYVSDNPIEYKTAYRVIYSSEVRLQDGIQPYKLVYTSWGLSENRSTYTIRYDSVGVGDLEHRKRWNIKYTSQSLGDFSTTYKIKYTASVFYDNTVRYMIRYSTQGSEKILTRAALIRKTDNTYDCLFQVRGTVEQQMDSYFYVLSNMPKYQHVEYTIGESLPYVDYIKYYEVDDIFDAPDNGRYEVKGYLILKNVDPNNSLSLDVYETDTYKRANRAKSYFFGLDQTDWESVNIDFKDFTITSINFSTDRYDYNYLNFVDTQITPVFNPGDTCCFSRKILPPGSPNINSGCSPF